MLLSSQVARGKLQWDVVTSSLYNSPFVSLVNDEDLRSWNYPLQFTPCYVIAQQHSHSVLRHSMSLYNIMYSLHDDACKLVYYSQPNVCMFLCDSIQSSLCSTHTYMYSVFMLIWSILRSIPYYFSLVSVCVEMYTSIHFVYNLYSCCTLLVEV